MRRYSTEYIVLIIIRKERQDEETLPFGSRHGCDRSMVYDRTSDCGHNRFGSGAEARQPEPRRKGACSRFSHGTARHTRAEGISPGIEVLQG